MRPRRPQRLETFDYKGKHSYFVTCATAERRKLFTDSTIVALCAEQILRTCAESQFRVLAYAFMEDHLHLLVRGSCPDSNFIKMMTLLRQRVALAYRRARGERLWQDGYFERVLRPTDDEFQLVRYIRDNPSAACLPEERWREPYVCIGVGDTDSRSAPL